MLIKALSWALRCRYCGDRTHNAQAPVFQTSETACRLGGQHGWPRKAGLDRFWRMGWLSHIRFGWSGLWFQGRYRGLCSFALAKDGAAAE